MSTLPLNSRTLATPLTVKSSLLTAQRKADLVKKQRQSALNRSGGDDSNPIQIDLERTGVREGPAPDPGVNAKAFVPEIPQGLHGGGAPASTADFVDLELELDGLDDHEQLLDANRDNNQQLHQSRVQDRRTDGRSNLKFKQAQAAARRALAENYDPRVDDRRKTRTEGKLPGEPLHAEAPSSFTPAPLGSTPARTGSSKKNAAINPNGPQLHLDGGVDTSRVAVDAFTAAAPKIAVSGGGASGTNKRSKTPTAKSSETTNVAKAPTTTPGPDIHQAARAASAKGVTLNPTARYVAIKSSEERGEGGIYPGVEEQTQAGEELKLKHGKDALVLDFESSTGFAYQA